MTPRSRTAVVALLVAAVAVRVSASQPLTAVVARIASDPEASLRRAAEGWTVSGTLGGVSAQGLRDLPLAAYYWLGSQLGLSAQVLQASWRVLVLVLALLGAIRLVRGLASNAALGAPHEPDEPDTVSSRAPATESWTPWVAAVLFSSGIVLVPTLVRSPLDGLAAATLPWIVAPLLTKRLGWRQATTSAAWLGLAGVGSPYWAAAAFGAAFVAAAPRSQAEILRALRWLVLAVTASAWWIAAFVWEHVYVRDVSALAGDGAREALADAVGRPDLPTSLLVLGVLGPLLVSVSALLLRSPGADRVFMIGLCGAAVLVGASSLAGWDAAVFAPTGNDPPTTVLGPVLGWLSLTGLVAWTPLVAQLGSRVQFSTLRELPSARRELAALVVGVAVLLTATAGLAAAGSEPAAAEEARSGLSAEIHAWSRDAPPGRVLVLPAGSDDALAPSLGVALGDRPWVGRDALPTSGSAATSALDDLLDRLGKGDGGPGTSSALRRLGISYVLMHLDGSIVADRENPAALVRSALVARGARHVAFIPGRETPEDATDAQQLLDFGVRSTTELVEIWSLPGSADGWVYEGSPIDVVGDAGTPSDLANAGVLGARAIRLRAGTNGRTDVLSDSARRRDVDQRVPIAPYGPELGNKEPRSVVPPDAAPVTTATRRFAGGRSVSSSSSAADLGGAHRRQGTDAMAAVDANVFTSWQSRRGTGMAEWWQIELDAPAELAGTTVQFIRNPFAGQSVTRVQVKTDQGTTEYDVGADGLLALEGTEQSKRLRITVSGVEGETGADDSVGIAEVNIPGVVEHDELMVTGPATAAWLLAARTASYTHCVPPVPSAATALERGGVSTVCERALGVGGPDTGSVDRVLEVEEPLVVTGRAWVRAADTAQSAALAERLAQPTVIASGSSVAAQDLVTRPQAAADADRSTAWRPSPEDVYPTLTLTWQTPAEVSGVNLVLAAGDLASVPTRVRIAAEVAGGGPVTTDSDVTSDGSVSFPDVRTRSIAITFLEDSNLTSVGSLTAGVRPVPIAVAEVFLVGGPAVRYDAYEVSRLDCGSGPVVSVDGQSVETAVTTSARDVVAGAVLGADLCDEADLTLGEVEVTVPASFSWIPLGIVLSGPEGELAGIGHDGDESPLERAAAVSAPVLDRLGTHRPVTLDLEDSATERTLALAVPAATGWEARTARGPLEPITVDGWSQAWAVPAGVERVELRYSPGGSLRDWVGGGAFGWALVLLLGAAGWVPVGRLWSRPSR